MALLNAWLGRAFDLILSPLGQLPAIVGVAAMSLVTAVAMLLVYKAVSDQPKLAAVKRAIVAGLFEIRLFNDDLSAIFRAQGEILRLNLRYLRLSLVPMLWLIVPFGLVVAHLEYRFGYIGPAANQPILVKATLQGEGTSDVAQGSFRLDAPAAVRVLTPAVWFPAAGEVLWQVSADADGEYELHVRVGTENLTKTFRVGGGVARRSPIRLQGSVIDQLVYPAEPPLPDGSAVKTISIGYQTGRIPIFGWHVPWLVAYFGLTMLSALALSKFLGVTL